MIDRNSRLKTIESQYDSNQQLKGFVRIGKPRLTKYTPTPLEAIIATAPIMFYIPLGGRVNVSLADFVLPLIAFTYLYRRMHTSRGITTFSWGLLTITIISWQVNQLRDPMYDSSLSLATAAKFAVVVMLLGIAYTEVRTSVVAENYRFLTVWTWVATILSSATVVYSFGGPALIRLFGEGIHARPSGSFEDPNLFASYLAVSIAVTMASEALGQIRSASPFILIQAVALMLTGSRGIFPALLLMLLAWVIYSPGLRRKARLLATLALVPGLAIVMYPAFTAGLPGLNRILSIATTGQNDIRLQLWERAVGLWLEHFWIGAGPGQYVRLSGDATSSGRGTVAHNTYLQLVSETGILGAAVFLCLTFLGIVGVLRLSGQRALKAALIAGYVGIGISMMSLSLENARFAWIFVAIAYAVPAQTLNNREKDDLGGESIVSTRMVA